MITTLVQDSTTCTLTTGTHNQTGVDPLLAILGDHGGTTRTHALLLGSPALDAASTGSSGSGGLACLSGGPDREESTDQRHLRYRRI